ncbi:type II secretion system protein GspH, partial [Psychromonas arctica]
SSGNTAQGSQWHAQRFSTLFQLTQDQALISNTVFGIQFNEQGYTFASYDVTKRQWLPLVNSRIEADVIVPDTV